MNCTIKDVLSTLDAMGVAYDFYGNVEQRIQGFSDPGRYYGNTIIWLGAVKYLKLTEEQSFQDVALLLCTPDLEGADQFPNRLFCTDPRNTFMELVERLAEVRKPAPGVASTAVVSEGASIGEGVSIGHYSVIEEDVVIGKGTRIGVGVVIHAGTRIGKNCEILDNTVIGNRGYAPRKLPDGSFSLLPHLGRVIIGDNVAIGSLCNIDQGTFKDTVIADGVKIDSTSLIGHNVEIGKNSRILASTIGGNCKVGEGVELIGMRCKNRLVIGDYARVGIGSVVITDVPPGVTCFGNPARTIKK